MAEQPETASSSSYHRPPSPPLSSSSSSATAAATTQNSPPESAATSLKQSRGPAFSGFLAYPNGDLQMFPVMYPVMVPGLTHLGNQEQAMNRGAGIYAVPVPHYSTPIVGLPPNTLIPLTLNIPT
ncbi:hypothetical protein Tsubulata_038798 [Turnera subulata]|uniref:Uncharacterized protein n=1 Tax=Turnera subulata TaxID=218843 RepID=A0A9Q0FNY2_9ROSI|nr:hypothetical protein Tsubulata_038798 [Turnera subulata]